MTSPSCPGRPPATASVPSFRKAKAYARSARVRSRVSSLPVAASQNGDFEVPADDELRPVRREGERVDDRRELVRLRRCGRRPAGSQFANQVGLRVEARVQLRPLLDPRRDQVRLLGRHRLALVPRRHPAFVFRDHQFVEVAFLRLARHDRLAVRAARHQLYEGGHVVLAAPLARVVAGEAAFLQHRGDVVNKADGRIGRVGTGSRGEEGEQRGGQRTENAKAGSSTHGGDSFGGPLSITPAGRKSPAPVVESRRRPDNSRSPPSEPFP